MELAVVIGRRARYVSLEEADGHIAGYTLHNDYSEREHQLERGGQWVKGKSADTFAPLGPFLATPDEVGDVGQLELWLTVNGESRQKGTTANMVFGVRHVVSYLSQFMTLLPGDVISTGTPPGVGLGFDPPRLPEGRGRRGVRDRRAGQPAPEDRPVDLTAPESSIGPLVPVLPGDARSSSAARVDPVSRRSSRGFPR